MKKRIRFVLRFLLIALLALIAALVIIPLTETQGKYAGLSGGAWMAGIGDDVRLNEIALPGTHDSGTQYAALPFFSKCQASSIGTQLEDGFRYLDIRLGEKDGRLVFWHGFCICRTGFMPWSSALDLPSVLAECYDFLAKNPSETIVFAVKVEHGEGGESFQKLLHNEIAKDTTRWLLTDRIPTLGECRGRIVLMRRYEDALGLGTAAGIPMDWAGQGANDDVSRNAAVEPQPTYTLLVQDRYKYGTDDKWNAFLAGLKAGTGAADELRLHFLSTNGTPAYGHPFTYAKELNRRFADEPLEAYAKGWIIVDFGHQGLAEHVYSLNFN